MSVKGAPLSLREFLVALRIEVELIDPVSDRESESRLAWLYLLRGFVEDSQ